MNFLKSNNVDYMGTILESIKQHDADMQEKIANEKIIKKQAQKDLLASTKNEFKVATDTLQLSINEMPSSIPQEHKKTLQSLISQAKQIIPYADVNRVKELTKIMTWANDALKGDVNLKDEKMLSLLSKEIKNEHFLDQKIYRVIVGVITTTLSIVFAATYGLTVATALIFASHSPIELSFALTALTLVAADYTYKTFFRAPNSVGREVRQAAGFFKSPDVHDKSENETHEMSDNDDANDSQGLVK